MNIDKIIDEVIAQHPYKVKGKPETYNQYNEGWSDACDLLGQKIKKAMEKLELEKEFTEDGNKYTLIYANKFAYLYEINTSKGKVLFEVFDRLKKPNLVMHESFEFKSDKDAINKFHQLTRNR